MARPPNPAFEGLDLTEQEKRAMYARMYRTKHLDAQREYQREYHRDYNQNPVKVLARVDERIAELVDIIERKTASYNKLIAPFQARLAALMLRQIEVQECAAAGIPAQPTRGRGRPRKEKTNA